MTDLLGESKSVAAPAYNRRIMTGPPRYFELIRQRHTRFDYRLRLVQTAREVRSGLLFLAFASRRSAAARSVFAARIQRHLHRYGVDLRHLVWQTDNGSEFIGGHDSLGHRTGFPASLGDSQQQRIPPAARTCQSDVETAHRLIEDEFFDLESFPIRPEFFAEANIYQLYFNLVRPNSHKGNHSPWQIIQYLAPRSPRSLLASSHQLALLSQFQRGIRSTFPSLSPVACVACGRAWSPI